MKPIITIENLSKEYPIVHDKLPYKTLRESITNFIHHPFAKRQTHESFYALKDINLTINQGDIVGIIGKNGSGKSTLLKIISGITKPTNGKVKLWGRVSSLLEVGTGFHPELTGRENIFLNGVILGMTRIEVAKKFDEIVAFAGIEKFLDTPVKHYSSGMYVRLAFAVAAHLEPDILIVDEVLAVGDAEFQKKCLGKMEDVSKKDGRTVVFVSHDLDIIENICSKVIYINAGKIIDKGDTINIINRYINDTTKKISNDISLNRKEIKINSVNIGDSSNLPNAILPIDKSFQIEMIYEINTKVKKILPCFIFYADSKIIYVVSDGDKNGKLADFEPGKYSSIIEIPAFLFNTGIYRVNANIQRPGIEFLASKEIYFRIINTNNNFRNEIFAGTTYGHMATLIPFNTKKND